MSLFSKLFGGGSGGGKSAPEPELYKEFLIFAEPAKEAGGYRVGARIEKEVGGEMQVHQLIRADTIQSLDEAHTISVAKAKLMIDQMGDGIFKLKS